MFKNIIGFFLALLFTCSTANAFVLATPAYDFSNGSQRNIIKRSVNEFLNSITHGTPCMVNLFYLNESSFVHFDRNVLVDITIMNKSKQVYYKRFDITRESFISDMNKLNDAVDKNCKK